ncbi:MAG TPA: DedA family protein [Armatimonadota bacterium]|nr:DedA family protein [Armatimonadota bacterium]
MGHLVHSLFQHLQAWPAPLALLVIAGGMMLESMCVPVPSEAILPLAGWWAAQGKFGPGSQGFVVAFAAVTAGCLIGSSIAYAIGYYGGKPLVERFGKYILVTPHRLNTAHGWIERYGSGAIIIGRMVFAVRALISFPVGILQMGYRRFLGFTLVGCTLWNLFAMFLGFRFGDRVEGILHRMSLGMFALVALVVLVTGGYYFWKTHVSVPAVAKAG